MKPLWNDFMNALTEYSESQIRKFMTMLFILRAKRHLKSLAVLYNWTPEMQAEYEQRFIHTADMIPQWNYEK